MADHVGQTNALANLGKFRCRPPANVKNYLHVRGCSGRVFNGPIPASFFFYFHLFSSVDSKQMFNINVCAML